MFASIKFGKRNAIMGDVETSLKRLDCSGLDGDLHWATAAQIVRNIRNGAVSARGVVENALQHIDRANAEINGITELYAEDALGAADAIDAQHPSEATVKPLQGVPFFLKEMTPVPGKKTTFGSRAYADNIIDYEPEILTRLKAAGAILLGKATCSELVCAAFTETDLFGITRNPWNLERTVGGSSGGSGAVVSAGFAPLAEGSDMGGSIRSPAAYTGVVGMKPSVGRIPWDVWPSVFESMVHFGPIAASVEDAALFLDATAGPSDRDILTLPADPRKFSSTDDDIRGMKIALNYDFGYYYVEPDIISNLDRTVVALRDLGAEVELVDIQWSREVEDNWYHCWHVYLAALLGDEIEARAELISPHILDMIKKGRALDAVSYKRIELMRTRMWRDLGKIFERYDALLCPATSRTAPNVGGEDADLLGYGADGKLRGGAMHLHFNFVSQCPSLSVPVGFAKDGMPTSVQFVGRRYDDFGVLKLGRAVEKLPFAGARCPALQS